MDKADTEALKALVALGKRMRDTEKAAADAWNQPTDAEHDRLSLEADHLFEDFGHAAEAALPSLERMLASQTQDMVLVPRKLPDEAIQRGLPSWVWNQCLDVLLSLNICAAPVASQMGEPVAWMYSERASKLPFPVFKYERVPEHEREGWDEIPLYAAPVAGMDADKIARDIVETYICTKRAENYESSVAEIAAIIRRTVK